MIIWLNGVYGVGKKQVAYELQRRLNGATLYDLTKVGTLLNEQLPQELRLANDEDYPEWRQWNLHLLQAISLNTQGPIIVPQTLTNETYLHEIIGGLRAADITVHHFNLTATPENIGKRLKQQGNLNNAFTLSHLKSDQKTIAPENFDQEIDTNEITVTETANLIAQACSLRIKPPIKNPLLQSAIQWGTAITQQFHH